jgi:hypothetical protein
MIEAYPLYWPAGYKKKQPGDRTRSSFKQSMETAQRFLRSEVSRLGGRDLVVSSNLPIRNDGMLYADWMRKKIEDPGVAIYFKWKNKDVAMCCDKYLTVWENMYALGKGIEAMRGLDRWEISEFLDRAFTGFKALPESTMTEAKIWQVLSLTEKPAAVNVVHAQYKNMAKKLHPDMPGGSSQAFQELQTAYQLAQQFFQS